MTRPTDASEPIDEAHFDRSIQTYRELGFSDERIAGMLIRCGHPLERVQACFPKIPESALPAAPVRADQTQLVQTNIDETSPRQKRDGYGASTSPAMRSMLQNAIDAAKVRQQVERAVPQPEESGQEEISFQYVPLIQCSFPHADPGEVTVFTRRNGWLELTLSTARPDIGLPYGVPARLLTIYCASEAIRTRSPEIFLGSSIHDFLRRLDVPISRGERGSLRVYANQLLRLIYCAISVDENIRDASGRQGLHIRQALFVREAQLWWDQECGVGQGSSLVLSTALFESILERSAPLSTNAIRQLRKSPMDLDVYAWLVHRLFQLTRPSSMSWEQLSGQFGHNYGELRYFRRFFGDSLKRVLRAYPEAKIKCTDAGLTLLPSKPHVERRALSRA